MKRYDLQPQSVVVTDPQAFIEAVAQAPLLTLAEDIDRTTANILAVVRSDIGTNPTLQCPGTAKWSECADLPPLMKAAIQAATDAVVHWAHTVNAFTSRWDEGKQRKMALAAELLAAVVYIKDLRCMQRTAQPGTAQEPTLWGALAAIGKRLELQVSENPFVVYGDQRDEFSPERFEYLFDSDHPERRTVTGLLQFFNDMEDEILQNCWDNYPHESLMEYFGECMDEAFSSDESDALLSALEGFTDRGKAYSEVMSGILSRFSKGMHSSELWDINTDYNEYMEVQIQFDVSDVMKTSLRHTNLKLAAIPVDANGNRFYATSMEYCPSNNRELQKRLMRAFGCSREDTDNDALYSDSCITIACTLDMEDVWEAALKEAKEAYDQKRPIREHMAWPQRLELTHENSAKEVYTFGEYHAWYNGSGSASGCWRVFRRAGIQTRMVLRLDDVERYGIDATYGLISRVFSDNSLAIGQEPMPEGVDVVWRDAAGRPRYVRNL